MSFGHNIQLKLTLLIVTLLLQTITQTNAIADTTIKQTSSVKLQAQPGFNRYQLGNYEITAISDGTVPQDLHTLLKGASKSEVDQLLANAHLRNPVEASINVFLINTGEKIILVDTGAGSFFGSGYGGKLIERLKSIGYDANQVTDILITHIHTDHTGGLAKDGKAVFPNATIYVGKPDLDFFLDEKNQNGVSGYDKSYFQQATSALSPYIKLGHISPIEGSKLLFTGVNAIPTPGHTPGHYFFKIESLGQSITFIGDSIHVESIQFPNPEITIVYDVDQSAAAKQRAVQFDSLSKDGNLIAAPHLPFPGIGFINRTTDGYQYIRAEYHDREIP